MREAVVWLLVEPPTPRPWLPWAVLAVIGVLALLNLFLSRSKP
jgi:hypothetical protein